MCGIAGILTPTPVLAGRALLAMTQAMRHRGPDGCGHVALEPGRPGRRAGTEAAPSEAGRVFLGHRRLSIIDPQGTAQPLCNEDGSVWTVFNGEIYNYRELRDELEKRGHVLREKGDTEVLVHLWETYGEDMADHLNGMFAFAVYDVRTDTLFLARDRFGEKPLFYWDGPSLFAFASELHVLPALDGFPRDQLDALALGEYFAQGYIAAPRTVYAAARCLPPGQTLVRRGGRTAVRTYWRPTVSGVTHRLDLDELAERIDTAVASRLVADVPVGCFLSGGLDSSLIAASMARRTTPRTFTIATGDPSGDESPVARRIAAHLGAEHREFEVRPDFVAVTERLALHYGQPFADYSAVPTYYVSRETRREVKVALSGDGGDELFAGYDRYANASFAAACGLAPLWLRRLLAWTTGRLAAGDGVSHLVDFLLSAGPPQRKIDAPSSLFHTVWRRKAFQPAFRSALDGLFDGRSGPQGTAYAQAGGPDSVSRQLETDQAFYLSSDILTKVDVASMSVSLETRAPFLDHRLVEYVNGLAVSCKLAGRTGKLPLRRLARQALPEGVADLPKRGFSLPMATWMRQELRPWCEAALFDGEAAWGAYLRPEAVLELWRQHQSGRWDHSFRLWSVVAMGLWFRSLNRLGPGSATDAV